MLTSPLSENVTSPLNKRRRHSSQRHIYTKEKNTKLVSVTQPLFNHWCDQPTADNPLQLTSEELLGLTTSLSSLVVCFCVLIPFISDCSFTFHHSILQVNLCYRSSEHPLTLILWSDFICSFLKTSLDMQPSQVQDAIPLSIFPDYYFDQSKLSSS